MKDFAQQLKEFNPTLYDIHSFIVDAAELEYGEIEFTVKTHNYMAKIVEMKAVKPKKKTMVKSITKRVMIDSKQKI